MDSLTWDEAEVNIMRTITILRLNFSPFVLEVSRTLPSSSVFSAFFCHLFALVLYTKISIFTQTILKGKYFPFDSNLMSLTQSQTIQNLNRASNRDRH